MARPRSVPRLARHKASDQAVVAINGRDHYLGPFGSPEAQEKYDWLIAEWLSSGRQSMTVRIEDGAVPLSVNEVLLR
jgi:hypothetical protein